MPPPRPRRLPPEAALKRKKKHPLARPNTAFIRAVGDLGASLGQPYGPGDVGGGKGGKAKAGMSSSGKAATSSKGKKAEKALLRAFAGHNRGQKFQSAQSRYLGFSYSLTI